MPPIYEPQRAADVWEPRMLEIETMAIEWAKTHGVRHHATDRVKVAVVPIDVQNSFCIPSYELFVGGRSGRGAVEDSARTARFLYQNLGYITRIIPTLDTHLPLQIFYRRSWINDKGEFPVPNATLITLDDFDKGFWRPNPAVAADLFSGNVPEMNRYFRHYLKVLTDNGNYPLTIWNYHTMLGTIGGAMVSLVYEALFFHFAARVAQPDFRIKGLNVYTEMYSPFGPEVSTDHRGRTICADNLAILDTLLEFDVVAILGQAKSHCVAWAIDHLLRRIQARDPELARKVYLVEDCTSPVVIPGVIDYTEQADKAFQRFKDAGMHVVTSDIPIVDWPDTNF